MLKYLSFLAVGGFMAAATSTPLEPVANGATNTIALCSFGVSLITVIIMLIGQRRTASTDYVHQLERRVETLQKEIEKCTDRIKDLERHNGQLMVENMNLLRQLARLDNH